MRLSLGSVFSLLFTLPLLAQEMRIPEAGPNLLNPRVQDFLKDYGPRYGLGSSSDGRLVYKKPDLDGKVQEHALGDLTSQRLLDMMAGVPSGQVEAVMADALNS